MPVGHNTWWKNKRHGLFAYFSTNLSILFVSHTHNTGPINLEYYSWPQRWFKVLCTKVSLKSMSGIVQLIQRWKFVLIGWSELCILIERDTGKSDCESSSWLILKSSGSFVTTESCFLRRRPLPTNPWTTKRINTCILYTLYVKLKLVEGNFYYCFGTTFIRY